MSEVNDNPEEEWQFLPPSQRQVYKAHVSSQLKEGKKPRKITITDNKLSIMIDISPLESLEQIWLNRNRISSIECLWEMKMFNLKKLSLSHNKLISFSPIRYMTCPNLDQLQLDHNLCDNEGKLGETKFNKNVMIWIAFTEENQWVQKKYLNKCINARFANIPIKMRD